MDKARFVERLNEGLSVWGTGVSPEVAARLSDLADELLRWNSKVNLTAITAPDEVVEKHFLDSLAILPELAGAEQVLDLGAGAGFPGLPLGIVLPQLRVVLVDAVAKKVGFMKAASATLGLAPRVRALHVRAEGDARREGLVGADLLVSRAFMEPEGWLELARSYVSPGGRVVAMLGKPLEEEAARELGARQGAKLLSSRRYALPFSKADRQVLVWSVPAA